MLPNLLHRLLRQLKLRLNIIRILCPKRPPQIRDSILNFRHNLSRNLIPVLVQALLNLIHARVSPISQINECLPFLILVRVQLSLSHHLLNIFFREAARRTDGDLLLLAGAFVFSRDGHDAVGVDVECDLDLWVATWGRGDALELEFAQELVVRGHFTCIPVDQPRENATKRLNTKGKWGHIKKKQLFHISSKNATLDCSTHGHSLVRVHPFAGRLAKDLVNHFLNLRDTCHATNEQNLINLSSFCAGILQAAQARGPRPLDQVAHESLEL
ncbi:NAD-specific glutamate dehydrogenase [Striga asiatica]|uniref:NAD-specific glutamate dehydrogenase n=1 Tax=Striga asiatica TaxID=4170 RepID=A0A5A7QAU9_STRAF|nr:NAD-specific glutamate dehydrogenase [Striga asiatica]